MTRARDTGMRSARSAVAGAPGFVTGITGISDLTGIAALSMLAVAAACATSVPLPPTAPAPVAAPPEVAADAPAAETEPGPPSTWAEALARNASRCPVPFFALAEPETVRVGDLAFSLSGSTLTLQGALTGPLKIGVLGAVKDADAATRENLQAAAAAFKKSGVHVVVANGDLVGNETAALVPVAKMLGEEFDVPVFVHSGNYEWTSAFTEAFLDAGAQWPHLFNMNIIRDVDLGGVHLLSLPGYFNRRFLQPGACRYSAEDIAELTQRAREIAARGDVSILTSHGPPLGTTPTALDVTNDGLNVGDPQLNRLLEDGPVPFGLFSHILESGGRAVDDIAARSAVPVPMKGSRRRLYVNVGAATSFGWGMNDGKTSRGMAAIFTVERAADGAQAQVEWIRLR